MNLLKSIINFIFFIGICLVPLPLFIDLFNFELVLNIGAFSSKPLIPIPFSIVYIAIVFSFFLVTTSKKKIIFFAKTKEYFIIISFVVVFLLYATVVSGIDVVRAVQLIFFVIPFVFFMKINAYKTERFFLFYFLLLTTIYFWLHIGSIATLSESLYINKRVFAVFWEFDIYQGLVSYPGVIFIYLAVSLFLVFFSGYEKRIKVVSFFLLISLIFLIFSAGRKISMIEVFLLFTISMLYILHSNIYYNKFQNSLILKRKGFRLILMNLILSVSVIFYFFNSQLYNRFLSQVEGKQLDGSRLEKWSNGFYFITHDIETLLFGDFPVGPPGFHNYFLDTVARVGLVGFAILLIIFFLSVNYIKKFYNYKNKDTYIKYLFVIFILSLLLQLSINSAFTQPYYLLNLFVAFIIVLNIKNAKRHKV
jgi:hypothetical protein